VGPTAVKATDYPIWSKLVGNKVIQTGAFELEENNILQPHLRGANVFVDVSEVLVSIPAWPDHAACIPLILICSRKT